MNTYEERIQNANLAIRTHYPDASIGELVDRMLEASQKIIQREKFANRNRSFPFPILDTLLNGDVITFPVDDEQVVEVRFSDWYDDEIREMEYTDGQIFSDYDCTGKWFCTNIHYFPFAGGFIIMVYKSLDV